MDPTNFSPKHVMSAATASNCVHGIGDVITTVLMLSLDKFGDMVWIIASLMLVRLAQRTLGYPVHCSLKFKSLFGMGDLYHRCVIFNMWCRLKKARFFFPRMSADAVSTSENWRDMQDFCGILHIGILSRQMPTWTLAMTRNTL